MSARAIRLPTSAEELVHAATHGFGALLSVGVLIALVVGAAVHGTLTSIVAAGVFGVSLVLVYVSSTIYHSVPAHRSRAKLLFRIFDHAAIHLLIAGTFTPIALCGIGGAWGWALLAVSWSVAALGIVVETTPLRHSERLSIALYVGAGWLGVLAVPLLWSALPTSALVCLGLGGLAYTAGVPFFLAHSRQWMHALWHAFVLAGSAFHVAAIALVVLR
ncbi:MAG: hemolysin III family protein [Myxococcota bacterium]|nr:hemolysin III family protein [Myxococcota bacterium]